MFTGLIQEIGLVREAVSQEGSLKLTVHAPLTASQLNLGDSVAVNGVCLSAVELQGEEFTVWLAQETQNLVAPFWGGQKVHLEPALRLGDRLGGHLVLGHVDGSGQVITAGGPPGDYRLEIEAPQNLAPFLAYKGSVALNGVSLTIAGVSQNRFSVALIPLTLSKTTLGELSPGESINLEIDPIARYLQRLENYAGQSK